MNIKTVFEDVEVLNIFDKKSDDGSIHWTEVVTMQGSDISSINCDPEVAHSLTIHQTYDFLLTITETLKATGNGCAYKAHKFKITGVYEK